MLSSRIKKQFRQSMKSLSLGSGSSIMSPLTSVFLLNFVLGFAIVQFIYWGSKGFNMPIILVVLVGFISAFFTKNMLIILLIALAFANLFHFGTMSSDPYGGPRINGWFGRREGMSANEDDESSGNDDSKENDEEVNESNDEKSKSLKGKKGQTGPASASTTSTKGGAGSKKLTGPAASVKKGPAPASASSGEKKSSSLFDSIDIDDPEKFMRDMEEMQPAMERAEKFMQIAQPFMSAAEPFLSTVQSFRGSSPAPASSK
jgi:hypothetical protein